jgi:hypothetical protein
MCRSCHTWVKKYYAVLKACILFDKGVGKLVHYQATFVCKLFEMPITVPANRILLEQYVAMDLIYSCEFFPNNFVLWTILIRSLTHLACV